MDQQEAAFRLSQAKIEWDSRQPSDWDIRSTALRLAHEKFSDPVQAVTAAILYERYLRTGSE